MSKRKLVIARGHKAHNGPANQQEQQKKTHGIGFAHMTFAATKHIHGAKEELKANENGHGDAILGALNEEVRHKRRIRRMRIAQKVDEDKQTLGNAK